MQALAPYIANYSLQLQIISELKFIRYKTQSLVKGFYNKLSDFIFRAMSSTLGVRSTAFILILLAWMNNTNYLVYALAVGYVLSNCMTMVIHEYWVHQHLQPKNRIIGFIFDYVGHLVVSDRVAWVYTHAYHHKHWKSARDVEVTSMMATHWIYYFMVASPVHGNPYHIAAITAQQESATNRLLPESRFLQQHIVAITFISHLVLLLIFGFTAYVYFVLFQIWLFHKYIVGFNELVTHYNNKTQEEEVDIPYLFPICCGTAYHKSHHALTDSIILGPGKIKYLNIQYYFVKLFYNITAKVPESYNRKSNHV
jgi:hypothetical protein